MQSGLCFPGKHANRYREFAQKLFCCFPSNICLFNFYSVAIFMNMK